MSRKIIFVNSHAIQYFAPLYKYMNEQGLSVTAWYCSDENVKGHVDRQFNSRVEWDVPLLQGYPSRFFRNRSWKPSIYSGFFGLINPGMFSALMTEESSVVVIHGWAYLTNVIAIIIARLSGHTVCIRGESPLNQEELKSKKNLLMKNLFLKQFLFRFVHKFLYIGLANKAFYESYGIKNDRLIFVPYAVDNDRFLEAAKKYVPQKHELKKDLGIPVNQKVILFAAKYILKKRPVDLIEAYWNMKRQDVCVVMVGEGELRNNMERFIRQFTISNVYLTGFVNQIQIEKYYAIADVFVLCSGTGETWGLSVNEAMNFNLPVVISSLSGCREDLVRENTGVSYSTGNVIGLEKALTAALQMKHVESEKVIREYSFHTIVKSFKENLVALSDTHAG